MFDYSFADELDLAILPFHDQTMFAQKIPHTTKYVAKAQVCQLVSMKAINPANFFTQLSQLFGEGLVSIIDLAIGGCKGSLLQLQDCKWGLTVAATSMLIWLYVYI